MAAKFMNSSDESSMGSAVYFSRRVFTENLEYKRRPFKDPTAHTCVRVRAKRSNAPVHKPPRTNVLLYLNPATIAGRRVFLFGIPAIFSH